MEQGLEVGFRCEGVGIGLRFRDLALNPESNPKLLLGTEFWGDCRAQGGNPEDGGLGFRNCYCACTVILLL